LRQIKEMALPPKYKASLRLETDGRVSGYGAASAFTGRYRLRSPGRIEWAENGFLITHDAQQPDPSQMPMAPPGTPQTEYCMRVEASMRS